MEAGYIQVTPENFEQTIRDTCKDGKTFVLFSGDKDENGKSWCPDCVQAEPYINTKVIPYCQTNNLKFFYCPVGKRDV